MMDESCEYHHLNQKLQKQPISAELKSRKDQQVKSF